MPANTHSLAGGWPKFRVAALIATIGLAGCATAPLGPPDFVATLRKTSPGVVGIGDGRTISGSGFRIAGTRQVITAAHVVRALRGAPIVTWSSHPGVATVSRIDDETDLAVLEIDADSATPGLPLAESPQLEAGQWVIVLGCPFGSLPTASVGVVSALPGAVLEPAQLRGRIQLNAAINPGNSGGPVVNLAGQVIGVANATIPGGFGIGFAVPVSALNRLTENGRATQ